MWKKTTEFVNFSKLVNSQYFEQLKHSFTKSWRINGQYICNCYFSTVYVTTVIIVYKEKD